MQSEDTVLINDLEDEIADHEKDVRKMTASEALDSLNAVKCFAEIHGDKQMNIMLNELTGKVEILNCKTLDEVLSICFLRNEVVSYYN